MTAAQTPDARLEEILRDPSAVFDDPGDVLADSGYARADKLRILEQWRYDMQQLQVAAGENLIGDSSGSDRLRKIDECLRQLSEGDAS